MTILQERIAKEDNLPYYRTRITILRAIENGFGCQLLFLLVENHELSMF